jgi:hypothetical protein
MLELVAAAVRVVALIGSTTAGRIETLRGWVGSDASSEGDDMPVTVPDVVTRYFTLHDDRDIDAIIALFTDDATVLDEGQTYRGTAEIRDWQTGAASKYTYSTTILDTESLPTGDYRVKARLEGNFPGGTVELKFDFALAAEHISKLEIRP